MAEGERHRLLKQHTTSVEKQDVWMKEAFSSPAARQIDQVLAHIPEDQRQTFKRQTFESVYEHMGQELAGKDLERVVVVRNEVSGFKTTIFLSILTLGLYLIFGGRDDDILLVLTTHGNVMQLKIDRPMCCPANGCETFVVFMKYMGILFVIVGIPNIVYLLFFNMTLEQEFEALKNKTDNFQDIPALIKAKYPAFVCSIVILVVWMYSMLPHGYMDEHRRRHMARECTTAQMCQWGCRCRRRSSLHLYFGKYPLQATLDQVGTLGPSSVAGTVPPSSLSSVHSGINASTLIFALTIFLTIITSLDTAFAWTDRSIALGHYVEMQGYCAQHAEPTPDKCSLEHCDDWVIHGHDLVSPHFCQKVEVIDDQKECATYGKSPPCCGGCAKGGFESMLDEGFLSNFKTCVSLFADTGTILFTLVAAKYAISMVRATDHIEVMIRRRTKKTYKTETANTNLTILMANDFAQTIMNKASKDHGVTHGESSVEEKSNWTGVKHFAMDEETETWHEFFKQDLVALPDTRWTLKLQVPRKLLGIGRDEEVLAGWVEMPLLPPPITLLDILMGKWVYYLLPFGKTRHAVVVTDRRLFYMRHRRPFVPLKFLGTDVRIDVFRHDHDIFYGRMLRHKLSTPQRIIHQILLREQFLPGSAVLQTKFGALELWRNHGDIVDVYNLLMSLSRDIPEFVNDDDLRRQGVNTQALPAVVKRAFLHEGTAHNNVFTMVPQPDDAVEPQPKLYLAPQSREKILFHVSMKDTQDMLSKYYTNLDVAVTSARVFFWKRDCYKKFDCCALPCWCFIWLGCLNRLVNPINLYNEMCFMTLPSILSFSTDLNVDSPSWLVPHHMPLKWPCVEMICAFLTRCAVRGSYEVKSRSRWSICPRRSGPSANLMLLWRLKQSAHADTDMMVLQTIKPYVFNGMPEADAEDIYDGLGYVADEEQAAEAVVQQQAEYIETLRKIMCAVQDSCHKMLNKLDDLGGGVA